MSGPRRSTSVTHASVLKRGLEGEHGSPSLAELAEGKRPEFIAPKGGKA
jgi:hypothetical protein